MKSKEFLQTFVSVYGEECTKIEKIRCYKAGYVVRNEVIDQKKYGVDEPLLMKVAYNYNGDYIGNPKNAHFLCKKMGIKPITINDNHHVCSIGFNELEKKWYGWSHRAIYGFGIGSEIKKGDYAYTPIDEDDFIDDYLNFTLDDKKDEYIINIKKNVNDPNKIKKCKGVIIKYTPKDYKNNTKLGYEGWHPYPDEWGKGEWTAKNLNDAKKMAIDFANNIS